jgi:hypothetical protein
MPQFVQWPQMLLRTWCPPQKKFNSISPEPLGLLMGGWLGPNAAINSPTAH